MIEYETIKRARAMLQASRTEVPSAQTIAGYKVTLALLIRRARAMQDDEMECLIACAKQTKSVSTWFSRRAALLFFFRVSIENLLADQDKVQRSLKAARVPEESPQWHPWKKIVQQIGVFMDYHDRLQAERAPKDRKPRHSKRKDMHGLPEDWRELIIAKLPSYRHAALTQAVTGCRSSELCKSVKLAIKDGELIALIEGAKVTKMSGQLWRRLSWPVNSKSPLVRMLVSEVQNGLEIVTIANAKAYSGAVRAAGKREWGETKKLSPYCFRHAAASDMKAGGLDASEISQALGHCADSARGVYGQRQMGRKNGGVMPKAVKASRAVKATRTPLPSKSPISRQGVSPHGHASVDDVVPRRPPPA